MTPTYRECYCLYREVAGSRFIIGFCWGWAAHLSGHIEPLEPFSRGVYFTNMGAVYCSCPWTETELMDAKEYSADPVKVEAWMLVSFADLLAVSSELHAMGLRVNPSGFVRFTSI